MLTFEKVTVAPVAAQSSLLTLALAAASPSSASSSSSATAKTPTAGVTAAAKTPTVRSSSPRPPPLDVLSVESSSTTSTRNIARSTSRERAPPPSVTITKPQPTGVAATTTTTTTTPIQPSIEDVEGDWGPNPRIVSLLKATQRDMQRGLKEPTFLLADEVLNNVLFIGGATIAAHEEGLRGLKVSAIVNATNLVMDNFPTWIRYFRVPVLDEEDEDILTWLPETTAFIQAKILSQKTVLVHCQAGVSRSATVVCAYLMRYGGLTMEEALDHTSACRPCVCPNIGFITQLQRFQSQLSISRRRAATLSSNSSLASMPSSLEEDEVIGKVSPRTGHGHDAGETSNQAPST